MPPAPASATQINTEALASDSQALTLLAQRTQAVTQLYGDGLPYDRNRVIGEARWYMAQSAEAMLEAGKRLIQLKENEDHGSWLTILEQQLQVTPRSAQKLMQAAVKYLSPALTNKPDAPRLLGLGKSKLLELLSEPDDALAELASGGTVAGLQLDEIDTMSWSELRAALKKERDNRSKDAAAKDKVLAKKEATITELEEQLARAQPVEGAEAEQAQLDRIRDNALAAEGALFELASVSAAVLGTPATEAAATAARQAVEFVAQKLADLINTHGLPIDFNEMVTPHWLAPVEDATPTKRRG